MAATSCTEDRESTRVVLSCLSPPDSGIGERRHEPVRCGVPWPQGAVRDPRSLQLLDTRGIPQPLQARALDIWPDGSARWILLDWLASASDDTASYSVVTNERQTVLSPAPLRSETTAAGDLVVRTGRGDFRVRPGDAFPFVEVRVRGHSVLDCRRSGFRLTDDRGRVLQPRIDRVVVEEEGPVRLVVRARGLLSPGGSRPRLRLVARLHFFRDSATVEVHLTLHNPRRAGHPAGLWALGSAGSVYIEDAVLTLAPSTASDTAEVSCSPELRMPLAAYEDPIALYQDSSGGSNWQSTNHLDRNLRVASRFRGYLLSCGDNESKGLRAMPVVTLEEPGASLGICVRHFWQNFPMAVEASSNLLALRLFPRQYETPHELQGGEQKTHVFHLAFDRDCVTDLPLDWCRAPLLVRAEPAWYADSGAVPFMVPRIEDPNRDYLRLVDEAIEGDDTFALKRERIDDYGWRNFGDLYADHEALFHEGEAPLISHYNNQYDAIAGFAIQFLRSGDRRWHELASALAQHVVDIDIYHTDEDKAAYNGGLFWHTSHYADAHTATHRGAPRLPGISGGGPSPGHLYTSGLLLHYFLTGNPMAREAVLGLGQYVIDSDDGRLSRFRLLSHAETGYASESGFDAYHGPGRTPGNAINALLDAHQLSSDRRFLDKAEQLIQRCVHPEDDLEARNLLDAEHRWFYTVFLVSLGKYLDHKEQLGELDRMWAYARASLLHYARWAVTREYPYLEKPEILEFPTETWAAQDMRKSEVFKIAARHSSGSERDRFLERARFFFDDSIRQLTQMETRTSCRPVVLLLNLGYSQAWYDRHPLPPARTVAIDSVDFGEPTVFVPQKARVKRRVLRLAISFSLVAVLSLLFYWLALKL